MRTRQLLIGITFALSSLLLMFISGCGPKTVPCGTFSFTGAPHTSRGINMALDFDFNPATCDSTCDCNTVVYIQIVRIIDVNTGNFLSPNSEQTNRIVRNNTSTALNGWAVDRLAGRVWGYYGRNNDGTFAGTLIPGSNSTNATLRDMPSGWPDRSLFDAVSVPICIHTDATCVNQLLGYYYWLFAVGKNGVVSNPLNIIAVEWHRDAVDQAVIEWNNDAPGLKKNSFPAFTRMES